MNKYKSQQNIKILNNVLSKDLIDILNFYIETKYFKEYTEHPGRFGVNLEENDPICNFLKTDLKYNILNSFDEKNNLDKVKLSVVTLCRDAVNFELPLHVDDPYKYISCVIYLNDNIPGTTFLLGLGLKKEIKAEINKLMYFKSDKLYHHVSKTDKVRYTVQFHYKLLENEKPLINLIGFDQKDLIKHFRNKSSLSKLTLDTKLLRLLGDEFKYNIVDNNTSHFAMNDREKFIHIGIDPSLKCFEDYKKNFFSYQQSFVGFSRNFLYDANNDILPINRIRKEYVMISRGSWNHKYKRFFKTHTNSFKKFLDREIDVFDKLWSSEYVIGENRGSLVVFVQNYSKYEYWFGWDNSIDDYEHWLNRELNFLNDVLEHTSKRVYIKFHPKMDDAYREVYKNKVNQYDRNTPISFLKRNVTLHDIFKFVDCCIVNSGSTAIMALVMGIPVFCIDDFYSSIPVHKMAVNNISKIDTFVIEDLPNRVEVLDFIFSQIFNVSELKVKIANETFEFE